MTHLQLVFTQYNQWIDLVDDSTIQIVYQIMTDISTKGGSYTYDMTLAGSGQNNIILSNIFDEHFYLMDSGTTIFMNKTTPAHIDFDGLPFLYGQFVLTEVDYDNGQITYIGHFTTELRTFGDQLGDAKIVGNDLDPLYGLNYSGTSSRDVDFSEYDHFFTFGNIDVSNNTTSANIQLTGATSYPTFTNFYNNSHGFYYGFIDFEGPDSVNMQEGNRALVQNFRPCIYAKELWDKIWDKTTYDYQSNFINSTYFKSLVIPYTFDNTQFSSARNPDGTLDQEFNVGIVGSGVTTSDFTGYGPVISLVNSVGVLGRSLYSRCFISSTGPMVYKTALFQQTGGTSTDSLPFYVNSDVSYVKTVCTTPDAAWVGGVPSCTQPYWQVSQTGTYDITAELQYNIYFEWEGGIDHGHTNDNATDWVKVSVAIWVVGPPSYNNPGGDKRLLKEENSVFYPSSAGNTTMTYTKTLLMANDSNIICSLEGQELGAGDKIFIEVGIQNNLKEDQQGGSHWNRTWLVCRTGNCYFTNKYTPNVYFNYGQKVRMNTILPPSYNQIDYIKDIMNYFCLVAQPIPGTNIIKVEPWNVFYNITGFTDYIEWKGPNRDILDQRGKKIESIPDLVYSDFWMNPKDDGNDTNTETYKKNTNRKFGSVDIPNPYIRTDSKTITTNFASTMMNTYGSTNWMTAQLWNKDNKPDDFNIPPEQTYEPRLLFRKKVVADNFYTPSMLNVYGGNTEYTATSNTTVVIPTTYPYSQVNFGINTNPDGTYPFFPYSYGDRQVVVYSTDNPSAFIMGTYSSQPTSNLIFTPYYTEGTGSYNSWFIQVIKDAFFGNANWTVPPTYHYQPYVGTLDHPQFPSYDINFGAASYYLTSNSGSGGARSNVNQVFNMYWKNKILTYIDPNSKYMTVYAWLTPVDIMNLDFGKKIMIDDSLYILNKLTWTPGEVSKAELIKLSDYPYGFYPYSGVTFVDGPSGGGTWVSTGNTAGSGGALPDMPNMGGENANPPLKTIRGNSNNNVLSLMPKQDSTIMYAGGLSGTTAIIGIQNNKNYYPRNSVGIVSGTQNKIDGNNFHLLNSVGNQVSADNVSITNSHYNIISHDSTVFINSTGVTTTDTGKTYINNRDVDTLTDTTYVNANYFNKANDVYLQSGKNLIVGGQKNYMYIGDPTTAGSWRFSTDLSGNLVIENKWSFDGNWYTQSTVTAKT